MKAYILGCSHAAGSEMDQEPGLTFNNDLDKKTYGYTRSYPAKIAQALGYEVENHAIPGGSNDAMYRIFCSLPITNQDIVIACWTGPDRTELFFSREQRWIQICNGYPNTNLQEENDIAKQGINLGSQIPETTKFRNYAKQWTVFEVNGFRGELNKAKNIEALNARAKQQNITVINIDGFAKVEYKSFGLWPFEGNTFCNWCSEQQMPRTDWGHYFEPAHREFADLCLKNIDRQKL